MTRGQRGRAFARAELVLAAFIGFVVLSFLFVAGPGFMWLPPPGWLSIGIPLVAVAGVVIGFAWMVRIYRSDPEPDQHASLTTSRREWRR